jgi:hypothetical protein
VVVFFLLVMVFRVIVMLVFPLMLTMVLVLFFLGLLVRRMTESRIEQKSQPCPYRKLYPAALMMKSAEDLPRRDPAERLDRPMGR